jgi:hypothetical protein
MADPAAVRPRRYHRTPEVAMSDVVYRSEVKVERVEGPIRRAWVPGHDEHVTFGVHSAIAEYYKTDPDRYPPDTTTIDYLVAAAAG